MKMCLIFMKIVTLSHIIPKLFNTHEGIKQKKHIQIMSKIYSMREVAYKYKLGPKFIRDYMILRFKTH
uniref:Uncharacterized protein n=1 Tax=Arundo donax TaxID=35708 RepID=A0A0A9EK29_ARUDO